MARALTTDNLKEEIKPEEKKAGITPQELDLTDKTRAELIRSIYLASKIVDLVAKIPESKFKDKTTEDSEREFIEAVKLYDSLWRTLHELFRNKEIFMRYVGGKDLYYIEMLLGAQINKFSEAHKKLKSGRDKVKKGLVQLYSSQERSRKEGNKETVDKIEENIKRLNGLLSVVRDEEITVLRKHLKQAKKSLVTLKEQLTKKTMTKKQKEKNT